MCSLMAIADKIGTLITDAVIQTVGHHVRYVIRYKKNLKDLGVKQQDLEKQMGKIEKKVDEAKKKGEIEDDDIVEWEQVAKNLKKETEEFMDAKAGNENTHCLKCSCPNLISRFRMSKKAKQKIDEIKGHTEKGKSFNKFSRRAPFPQEIQYTSSQDFVNFESRTPLLKMIKEELAAPTVKIVGVYGTGGVGKTTTVEEVSKQVKAERLFDDVVIAIVSQNANIKKIQGQIADRLDLMLSAETEEGRAGQLWNRLRNGKKNLVILDDIWEELNLKVIGIPTDCKVIFTTRNRDVLRKMQVDRDFLVQLLSQEEAWVLFKKKVGDSVYTHELHSIAKKVCAECGGLPVAIVAVGAALKGKNKNIWADALNQLENSSLHKIEGIDPKLYVSLKLSCDALGKEAKSCFLLCCLYPEDAEILIDDLLYHCVSRRLLDPNKNTMEKARVRMFTLIDTLKTCSLLLDGKSEYFVKMHDVIRDVGISIAKTEERYMFKHNVTEWPDQSTYEHLLAMSLEVKNVSGVPAVLACRKLHTFMLESSDTSFEFPESFFSEVKDLKVLVLKNVNIQSIPSSHSSMFSLRMLCLEYCKLEDVNILRSLKNNLEVLRIQGTVWEALPLVLGELTRLQVLDLTECKVGLLPPGVLSNLTRLEELYLPDKFDLWEYWDNIDAEIKVTEVSRAKATELRLLTKLSTLHVSIPFVTQVRDLRLDNLTRFRISVGGDFYLYGDIIYEKMLQLKCVTIQHEANNLLQMCQYLWLDTVKGLKNVFDIGGVEFVELRGLRMINCHDVDYLHGYPQGLYQTNSFSNLTELVVYNCSFKYLFSLSCAKKLTQLRRLAIWECENLEEIIITERRDDGNELEDMVHFTRLKAMGLYDLPNLVSFSGKREETTESEGISCSPVQFFFNEKVTFPALEELSLSNLPNIAELLDKKLLSTESSQLTTLQVTFPALEVVFFACLPNMEKVKQQLRKGEVKFPAIQFLKIDYDYWYENGEANMQLFDQQSLEGEVSSKVAKIDNDNLADDMCEK